MSEVIAETEGVRGFVRTRNSVPSPKPFMCCVCLIAQATKSTMGSTLRDPMDCIPPGSSVHEDCPSKNTGVSCCALFQGIFPTQELNPGLPHCRQILYCLNHQGSPNHS